MFIIGPTFSNDMQSIDIFAPKIHIKEGKTTESYRMCVYAAGKTLLILLFKIDYQFTLKFLDSLNTFLQKNIP